MLSNIYASKVHILCSQNYVAISEYKIFAYCNLSKYKLQIHFFFFFCLPTKKSCNMCLITKGPFKYYVIKEVGEWGQKMAIFDDLQYMMTKYLNGPLGLIIYICIMWRFSEQAIWHHLDIFGRELSLLARVWVRQIVRRK